MFSKRSPPWAPTRLRESRASVAMAWAPPPVGDVIETVTIDGLTECDTLDRAEISNTKLIASYNWVEDSMPKIMVPGMRVPGDYRSHSNINRQTSKMDTPHTASKASLGYGRLLPRHQCCGLCQPPFGTSHRVHHEDESGADASEPCCLWEHNREPIAVLQG